MNSDVKKLKVIRVYQLILNGMSVSAACKEASIDYQTFQKYKEEHPEVGIELYKILQYAVGEEVADIQAALRRGTQYYIGILSSDEATLEEKTTAYKMLEGRMKTLSKMFETPDNVKEKDEGAVFLDGLEQRPRLIDRLD